MVAAILRSHRHNNGIYPASIIDVDKRYSSQSGADVKVSARFRVIRGQLFVKTELYLMPRGKPGDSCVMVPFLQEILEKNRNLMHLCRHHRWDSMRYIFDGFGPTADLKTRFAHNCLWNHGTRCKHRTEAQTKRMCRHCCTAIAVACSDVRDGSNMVILSTWKSYGHGLDVNDPLWLSHNKRGAGNASYQRDRQLFAGTCFVKDGLHAPFRGIPSW